MNQPKIIAKTPRRQDAKKNFSARCTEFIFRLSPLGVLASWRLGDNLLVGAALAAFALNPALAADAPKPEPTIGAGNLGPKPVAQPMMPDAEEDASASAEAKLDRRLNELVRACDQKINDILKDRGGTRPTGEPVQLASHDSQRRERDQAWLEFRKSMQTFVTKSRSYHNDAPAPTDPKAKAEQGATLNASNQLAVAECYKELLSSGTGKAEDLAAGYKALDLDPKTLPTIEQPKHGYLKVWYLAEQARRATGAERDKLIAAAEKAQKQLLSDFPNNSLAQTASALLLDLGNGAASQEAGK